MASSRIRLLALMFLLTACGGGGSREPTVISGNVTAAGGGTAALGRPTVWASVLRWLGPEAHAQAPGIIVAIVNTERSAITDEGGLFRMEVGQFGTHTLRFSGSGADATLAVVLPFGGTYELRNVEVSGNDITVEEQAVQFRGPITGVDCQQNLLQVLSGERIPYRVRIVGGTIIRDENGETLTCSELTLGREAAVSSVVEELDTVIASEIQVNPSRVPPSPTATVTAAATATGVPTATQAPSTPTRTATATRTATPSPTASATPTSTT